MKENFRTEYSERTELYEKIIDAVQHQGYGIIPSFITLEMVAELRSILHKKYQNKQFKGAGIGNSLRFTQNNQIRSDEISWIDNDSPEFEAEKVLTNELETFMNYLNRSCYTGLQSVEFHFAQYNKGSFYKRHLDQFRNNDHRKYTLILYLNENWVPADGGQLVLYLENGPLEISPLAGTIVFFESAHIEHEVMVCNRERLSVTGWFKTK